jgi:hypothetical protein
MNPLTEILGLLIDVFRKRPITRVVVLVVSGIVIGIAALFYLGTDVTRFRDAAGALIVLAGSLFLAALLSFTTVRIGSAETDAELRELRREREAIKKRITQDDAKEDVFDTIQLSLNQITEYYTINKSQARNSFRFSIFAIVVGLIVIVIGVFYFQSRQSPQIITLTSGVLLQFIGGAYFYLYRISIAQLNFYHERLVNMQNTMLGIKLMEQMDDKEKQNAIRERLIWELISRGAEPARSPSVPSSSVSAPVK